MRLETESGKTIAPATEEDIRASIEGEEFVILSQSDQTYMQCAERDEPPHDYVLEYREGSVDLHFHATDRPIGLERVEQAFIAYLRGDDSWRTAFRWERLDMGTGGSAG